MYYELTCLINGIIPEEKVTSIIKNITGLVEKYEGKMLPVSKDIFLKVEGENLQPLMQIQMVTLPTINDETVMVFKRRLSYPIKHKRQGYYVTVNFTMEKTEDALQELEKELKLEEEILRHIIIKKFPKPVSEGKGEKAKKEKPAEEAAPAEKPAEEKTEEKAETKEPAPKAEEKKAEKKKMDQDELEKKLDKILNI